MRAVFGGPLIYVSLTFEQVDWTHFEFVGVDHYRDSRTKDRYVEMLQPFLAVGKPVIVTEFGMRTYHGAESSGTLGFGVTDTTRLYLHTRPVIGRFIRPRIKGSFERDETMQAASSVKLSTSSSGREWLERCSSTFVTPGAELHDDARYDLDMDSMSIVKSLPAGRHGTTYPNMNWQPRSHSPWWPTTSLAVDPVGPTSSARRKRRS